MRALLWTSLILVFASCTKKSTKIETNDIYQHYRIEYNEHLNHTKVRCRLRKKKELGANINFVDGDQVKIMDLITEYGGAGAYTYEREFTQFLDTAFVEVFHQGTTLTNFGLFDNAYTCSIPASQDIIYTGFTWYFQWDGPPIQGDFDRIFVEILNSDDEVVFQRYNTDDDYDFMTIPSSEFSALSGIYKIRVTRSREMSLITLTASGGKIEMVYIDQDYINII